VFTAGVKQILVKNERVGKEKERKEKKKRNKLLNDWSYSALGSHYSWRMEVITMVGA
jgi:hypothetical protein